MNGIDTLPRRELEALLHVATALTSTLELTPLLKEITQRTAQAVGVDRCSVSLFRDGVIVPVMSQYADGHTDPDQWERYRKLGVQRLEDNPILGEAIATRQAVIVEDAASHPRVPAYWTRSFGITSAAVVPLIRRDEAIGALTLDYTGRAGRFTGEDIRLATTIAAQVALAIDNARLFRTAEARAAELGALEEIARALTSTLDLPTVLDTIAASAVQLVRAHGSAVAEVDPTGGLLRARTTRGLPAGQTIPPMRLGQGAAGTAAQERRAVWSPDVERRPLPAYDEPLEDGGQTFGQAVLERGYRAVWRCR